MTYSRIAKMNPLVKTNPFKVCWLSSKCVNLKFRILIICSHCNKSNKNEWLVKKIRNR